MTGSHWAGWTAAMLSIVACDAAPSASSAAIQLSNGPARNGRPVIAPWDATRCGDDAYQNARMERHPALMGLSSQALEGAWGAPAQREQFRVGSPVGTFYGALGRRRSGRPHADTNAPAQALTWRRAGCNFSVFFVKRNDAFRAVNAFEWAVGADF